MSRLHEMKVAANAGDHPQIPRGSESNRAGTRKTRTMAKTARACGFNYTPTTGWRERSQVRSSKIIKSGSIKGMRKQAKIGARGDAKQA